MSLIEESDKKNTEEEILPKEKNEKILRLKNDLKNKRNIIYLFICIVIILLSSLLYFLLLKNNLKTEINSMQNTINQLTSELNNIKNQLEPINKDVLKIKAENEPKNANNIFNNLITNSDIVKSTDDIDFILKGFPIKPRLFMKIFSAKEQGCEIDSFHIACDAQGPTLFIIKTNIGKIFGGFTELSWHDDSLSKRSPNLLKNDPHSFLFSLDKKKIRISKEDKYSIYVKNGPTFMQSRLIEGGKKEVYDSIFEISDFCFDNSNSFARFGQENHSMFQYSNGADYFKVENYEVYRVLF